MRDILLEEVFEILEKATRLEMTGRHRIEAATKYYEACYLMRKIIDMGVASEGKPSAPMEGDNRSQCTISSDRVRPSCHRLLKAKIEHYTKVAQRLYFDETSIADATTTADVPPETNGQHRYYQPPPRVIMTNLLDDVISVLSVPSAIPVAVAVKAPKTSGSNGSSSNINRTSSTSRAAVVESPAQLRKDHLQHHKFHNRQNVLNKNMPSPKRRLPRQAFAQTERTIHLRMDLANSRLRQAIDMDEYASNLQQGKYPNNRDCQRYRQEAVDAYVEASELYLGAIKLAEDQKGKLPSNSRQQQQKSGSLSSDSSNRRFQISASSKIHAVLPKLKRLLVSSLDRVETLKKSQTNLGMPPNRRQLPAPKTTKAPLSITNMGYARPIPPLVAAMHAVNQHFGHLFHQPSNEGKIYDSPHETVEKENNNRQRVDCIRQGW